MRGLMILCFAAVTLAAPQYNYQGPASSGFSASGSALLSSGGSFGGSGAGSYSGGGSYSQPQATIITKHFHSFAAPEEHADESIQKSINLGPGRKHYRVVFIKAPHQSSRSAAIQIAQAQNEEKTVIYVLSKKPDAADIQTHIQQANTAPSKPEVFFIKYKTQEEAAHAQHQIQSQYDSLGGSSQFTDEGLAPVSSVIGTLGGGGGGHSVGRGSGHSGAYLPPN